MTDTPLRALLVHNYYQQPGGEDGVFAAETALLEAHGHPVRQLTFDNDAIPPRRSAIISAQIAARTVWSRQGFRGVRQAIRAFRPDVIHFHNTFPLISPAAYYAAAAEGVPVVQTLHNYRLFCTNGLFYRDGHVCEDCLNKPIPLPGVLHACYRGSRAASGTVAAMLTAHRALHTWTRMVDRYIVLTPFAYDKCVEGGLPPEKLTIKPNFVSPDPGPGTGQGGYALFVGRLSPEKGVGTLLRVWEQFAGRIPLKIVGDGPLAPAVAEAARRLPNVEWLAQLPQAKVFATMQDASVLVFPSEWYEGLPRTVIESFAAGTPVIAPRLGAMEQLIRHHHTGLHYPPGDPDALAAAVEWAFAYPTALAAMRVQARIAFEQQYTAEENYEQLMKVYTSVV